jgi:hypothetical protein
VRALFLLGALYLIGVGFPSLALLVWGTASLEAAVMPLATIIVLLIVARRGDRIEGSRQ